MSAKHKSGRTCSSTPTNPSVPTRLPDFARRSTAMAAAVTDGACYPASPRHSYYSHAVSCPVGTGRHPRSRRRSSGQLLAARRSGGARCPVLRDGDVVLSCCLACALISSTSGKPPTSARLSAFGAISAAAVADLVNRPALVCGGRAGSDARTPPMEGKASPASPETDIPNSKVFPRLKILPRLPFSGRLVIERSSRNRNANSIGTFDGSSRNDCESRASQCAPNQS
eukprot:4147969-Prymnesium_polylepis.2